MAAPFITLIVVPGIAALELDATISNGFQGDVEVTEHPVEVGADMSDHARVKPEVVTIEGIISNTPLNRSQATRIVQGRGVALETTALTDAPAGAAGHAETALAKLIDMKDARQLVTVVTERRTYKGMMLTSLSVPHDAKTGDALRFTATFKQVRLAEVRRKEVTVTREPKAKGKTNTGKQAVENAPEQAQSTLHRLGTRGDGKLHNSWVPESRRSMDTSRFFE